jgi:predicted small lipoprotein YifL
MRIASILVVAFMVTACGQTGSLYLPDDTVETPVEIRTPAASAPTAPADEDEDEEKKYTQLPGG